MDWYDGRPAIGMPQKAVAPFDSQDGKPGAFQRGNNFPTS